MISTQYPFQLFGYRRGVLRVNKKVVHPKFLIHATTGEQLDTIELKASITKASDVETLIELLTNIKPSLINRR